MQYYCVCSRMQSHCVQRESMQYEKVHAMLRNGTKADERGRGALSYSVARPIHLLLARPASRPLAFCLTAAILFCASGLFPPLAAGAWLTGSALQKRLADPIDLSWSGPPLRDSLQRLSQAEQIAVFLDRRIDPGRKLDLKVSRTPLRSALEEIASRQQIGFCLFGSVAYFGPPTAAAQLRTLSALRTQEVRRLPAAGRLLLQSKPLAWADFATPRDILTQLAQQNGLTLEGLDRVPHDLWAAADLPPLPLVDRLTLVALQFDLTFTVSPDGRTITLVPVPDGLVAENGTENGPAAKEKPRRPGVPPERPPAGGEKRVHTLRIEKKPLGPVLQELARRLNFELQIDQKAITDAGISLDQLISVQVQKASDDELLRAVTRPAGLEFRRQGNVLEIGPAKR